MFYEGKTRSGKRCLVDVDKMLVAHIPDCSKLVTASGGEIMGAQDREGKDVALSFYSVKLLTELEIIYMNDRF